MNNGDKPASPVQMNDWHGLTKREHIAAMAMQGLLAGGADKSYMSSLTKEEIANHDWDSGAAISLLSVSYANALLNTLEETK